MNLEEGINVLSFFDGMSCGQIALERAGIKVKNYYACEIDKHAIKVTQHNYPNTVQLGSVTEVGAWMLPKIDLFIGGSPCQGFSFAGKQLNFEDPRSKLFFEFVRVERELREANPDLLFMLENVKMKKEFEDIISQHMGVEPVFMNSALVSAQNRKRLYWTNIIGFVRPKDKGLILRDIIDENVDLKYFKTAAAMAGFEKRYSKPGRGFGVNITSLNKKSATLTTRYGKDGKECILKLFNTHPSGNGMNGWVYDISGKAPTLTTNKGEGNKISDGININGGEVAYRKLTPLECERLQTVPENYTDCVSNTQRYHMLGNGWTVDVIAHIFKGIHYIDMI